MILANPAPLLSTVNLMGTSLHCITEKQCVDYVLDRLSAGVGGWVVTHNLDHLRLLQKDDRFRKNCEMASLRVADGMPLVWAASLQGKALPERVTGSNLISSLSAGCAKYGYSVFLLGGSPGVAERAASSLSRQHRGLKIVGTQCPSVGFQHDASQLKALSACLGKARPDVIFLSLGAPLGENMICYWRDILPQSWWLSVGAGFNFLSGHLQRAPVWMQRMGLEWIDRLRQEPGRLWRRYLVHDVPCAVRLFASASRVRTRKSLSQKII